MPAENACARCGTCCRKGGPALHAVDLDLLVEGGLVRAHLYALRRGELAYDPVAGELEPLEEEIVKIKGREGSFACVFLVEAEGGPAGCANYENRPLECRLLDCRAPEALAAVYAKDRLTRRDLLPSSSGLDRLLTAHDERCSHVRLRELIGLLGAGDESAGPELMGMLHYDAQTRALARDRLSIPDLELDLLFGRALARILPAYGLRLEMRDEKPYLAAANPSSGEPA